jgi:hypothetical protein
MKTKTNRKQQKSKSELQSRPEPLRNQKAMEDRPSLYQTVTDRIIASLKAGVIPWEKPWKTPRFKGGPFPRNFLTGKPYRGINILLLWDCSFSSPFWLTFKQAQELKGMVRKGESLHSFIVITRFLTWSNATGSISPKWWKPRPMKSKRTRRAKRSLMDTKTARSWF